MLSSENWGSSVLVLVLDSVLASIVPVGLVVRPNLVEFFPSRTLITELCSLITESWSLITESCYLTYSWRVSIIFLITSISVYFLEAGAGGSDARLDLWARTGEGSASGIGLVAELEARVVCWSILRELNEMVNSLAILYDNIDVLSYPSYTERTYDIYNVYIRYIDFIYVVYIKL